MDEITDPEAAPTMLVFFGLSDLAELMAAALLTGWVKIPAPLNSLAAFVFYHPSGREVPAYRYRTAVEKLVDQNTILALASESIPRWAYRALGIITGHVERDGLRLAVHRYYPETESLRTWTKETRCAAKIPA